MPNTLADNHYPRKCKTPISVQRLYFLNVKSGRIVQLRTSVFNEFKILESFIKVKKINHC